MPGPTRSNTRVARHASLGVPAGNAHPAASSSRESRLTRSQVRRTVSYDSTLSDASSNSSGELSDSISAASSSSLVPSAPLPLPPTPMVQASSNQTSSLVSAAQMRESKRRDALVCDKYIVPSSVTATSVVCARCTSVVHLDKRGSRTYYASNWKRHLDACLTKNPELGAPMTASVPIDFKEDVNYKAPWAIGLTATYPKCYGQILAVPAQARSLHGSASELSHARKASRDSLESDVEMDDTTPCLPPRMRRILMSERGLGI